MFIMPLIFQLLFCTKKKLQCAFRGSFSYISIQVSPHFTPRAFNSSQFSFIVLQETFKGYVSCLGFVLNFLA